VCGTGGAAAGIVCKAAAEGAASVYIIGRNEAKARELMSKAAGPAGNAPGACATGFVSKDFAAAGLSPDLECVLADADIFINATPLGMKGAGSQFAEFSFLEKLPERSFVYDLVYEPAETELVKAARDRGLGAENGLSMLVYQAILSDELFFGMETKRKEIYDAVRQAMV
jgi:shikimate dehydrogenase